MTPQVKADLQGARRAKVAALLLRMDEVAEILGVSVRTVWTLVRTGELPAVHPPGIRAIRVAREDVDALVVRWREQSRTA
ncbi:MAG: helix-turn-helix domain-containing protein [Gemmatimonadales bacterium]|nr:helix-turn-helix domain-containing protein [Gemmatimonadales bacterium]